MNCPKCHHPWRQHETEMQLSEQVIHECSVNMGMGDWCGCKMKRPAGWSNVEDVIEQVERGSTRLSDPTTGTIQAYVIPVQGWQALAAQLRRAR